ncbi:uncharacterized protein YcfL [Paenibacillus sp. V4I3]|uniref:hypothetical protein n=1 Tax=unclassified Paenibacillus TaxID=185978 RepID=UPI0027896054|nr:MULTISPECIES: hypothetical protein [unclassified Paenibacillus]MDQ0876049.1 uncharacterized protein YcfL [Paenibacillus sp. V4I3]MDQ0896429.1 uncharacterized protein YcfL [Paenibacillus sp. V4I7]MDQ0914027.1 uncharacterized protein YcfL [Paenibacillus sp. V4I5]
MGRSILILIFSMMLICVGCQSKQQINNDKLVVLKRSGTENKHEKHKEVTDKNTVLAIKSVLKKGDWKKSKISMTIPPDYKIYFEPTDGSEALSVWYDVWFTNEFAEVYIEAQNLYRKLSVEDSLALRDVIQ